VIKVLKPGIEDTLVADLNFIYVVARVLEFLNPELQRTSLVNALLMMKFVCNEILDCFMTCHFFSLKHELCL